MQSLSNIFSVYKRELKGYFTNPMVYVLMALFVLLSMAFGFLISQFLKKGDASLVDFFTWHPWIFMIVGPALGMKLWAEEQRLGTIELLMTMPVAPFQIIVGKYLAACTVILASLVATVSMVFTVRSLGEPDGAMILSGYIGSFLVGCASVAITCFISALFRDQVACLLLSVVALFFLVLAGYPPFQDFVTRVGSSMLAAFMAHISLMYHSNLMMQGRLPVSTIIYFLSLIAFCLFLTSLIIKQKRS